MNQLSLKWKNQRLSEWDCTALRLEMGQVEACNPPSSLPLLFLTCPRLFQLRHQRSKICETLSSTPSPGMASGDGGRANWKDPELYKLFIDLCLKESTENGKNGGSLKKESWDRVRVALNKEKNVNLSQKQLKNQWEYLKSKYGEWSKIISKTGNGYDPVTNTVNWSTEEWSEYIQANPNAKQFRYTGLQYANELKALFDGVRATGRFSWGPSKEGFPADGTPSQS
ncbi:hypothetical protein Vadar_022225 [Vaccinium darrowii]|uniref:Uncharacterized protein n=1 Tax=Vaccinium darrowii TaxID=229202 RepID=A0ACB7ZEE0_9ERIC|nr:hypothetical protein Vadar_022225 [Vaccinium darrowii]